MGSFLQLVAVYSDMPREEDRWQEAAMLEKVEDCDLCRRACPTGAISVDRFLLRAERCISYQNEKRGDVPFPSWMDVSWHNCLEGCMRCQRACPLNKQFLGWVGEEEEFSEEETRLLLNGASRDNLQKVRVCIEFLFPSFQRKNDERDDETTRRCALEERNPHVAKAGVC